MRPRLRRQGLRRPRLRRPLWWMRRAPLPRLRRLRWLPLQLQLLPVVGLLPDLLSIVRLRLKW